MPSSKDIIVAVMGVTGTGKSSFIRLVTGDNSIKIGEGLQSATTNVAAYRFAFGGYNFVLVDTPGFDDTVDRDEIIVKSISEWLAESYIAGQKLNGILYMHRIIDPRMQGTVLRNFKMFRSLCGKSFYKQVILGTTFWSTLRRTPADEATGQMRLDKLISTPEYWGEMVRSGSQVTKISDDRQEASQLLLKFVAMEHSMLQVQDEMINRNIRSENTSAARCSSQQDELDDMQATHEDQKNLAVELHALKQRLLNNEKLVMTEAAKTSVETESLRQELLQMRLDFQHKLDEQAIKFHETLLSQEGKRKEDLRRQNEAALRASQARLKMSAHENACILLLMQLQRGHTYGTIKCTIQPGGRDIAICDQCSKLFNAFGMYRCNICRGANFNVCDPCYGKGKKCLNEKHMLVWRAVPPIQAPEKCLAKSTDMSARLCSRCEKKLLQVYLRKLKLL
ncbi:P-loop containing nucleoside triphosphate hydrolase protein [Alternaria alternata]|nr:P-loop containing nucleoside triphosphate hydrolase protein [Alternaria alternata]